MDTFERSTIQCAEVVTEGAAVGTNRSRSAQSDEPIHAKIPRAFCVEMRREVGFLRPLRGRIMKKLTGFPIVIVSSAVTLCVVQAAVAADSTGQSTSAPVQVMVAPLAVSSAPLAITFAPPRPATTSTPSATPKSEVPEVKVVASLKDRLPTSGYRRIVFEGQGVFLSQRLGDGLARREESILPHGGAVAEATTPCPRVDR
jgi:hypothetical protein